MMRIAFRFIRVFSTMLLLAAPLAADEGMWTFDNPPLTALAEKYGFRPSPEWLDRIRLASVRFNDGGSGSFVSPDGLMLTNHHVGLGCIQSLSGEGRDYVGRGFLAASRAEEMSCPGYEVNVLVKIEDVTGRVLGGVQPEMTDAQARDARKGAMASIENECHTATGLRCDVVTLYQGGEYHLYSYRKYTDVRLVFAPEQQAAFFGGDYDNFTFPRHDLDVAFFRAYENGQPVKPAAWLPWSVKGASEGDLVFVSGHPGSTRRLYTTAQLEAERDVVQPEAIAYLEGRLATLRLYAEAGAEPARRALSTMFSLENSLKGRRGRLAALDDVAAMTRSASQERELRARVAADPELKRLAGDAWDAIAAARKRAAPRVYELRYVGFGGSRLLDIAGQIVRYVVETRKPNNERLEEYVDAGLESLRNLLFSAAPIYPDLEEATLAGQITMARDRLGPDDAFVSTVLGGRSPEQVAHDAVSGTRLADVAARRALVDGGPQAVAASTDAMIDLARRIDPLARELRKWRENEVDAPVVRAGERIANARFAIYGKTLPPDATGTLRLSVGVVKGFPAEGTEAPPFTTFYGLYDRAAAFGERPPWNLAPRLAERCDRVELKTPLNFASTNDIIGGNSGSPVVNRDGQFVGVIFDTNIYGLAWDYFYTEERARSVSVDARAIVEALRRVYDAERLADELLPES